MYDALYERIDQMFATVTPAYAGHEGEILRLIDDCRQDIEKQMGKLGPWEIKELAYAEVAVKAHGWLKLALHCAEKALDVSQLPPEEYDAGYNYTRKPG